MDAETVVKTYSDMIYRIAMRYVANPDDAEDVYSEVFLTYFKKPRSFESEEHRKAWLIRVTINCAKDQLTDRMQYTDLDEVAVAAEDPGPDKEELLDLRRALNSLKEDYREPICMYHLDGMSIREISEILGKPENTIKSLLARGREMLRKQLEAADLVTA